MMQDLKSTWSRSEPAHGMVGRVSGILIAYVPPPRSMLSCWLVTAPLCAAAHWLRSLHRLLAGRAAKPRWQPAPDGARAYGCLRCLPPGLLASRALHAEGCAKLSRIGSPMRFASFRPTRLKGRPAPKEGAPLQNTFSATFPLSPFPASAIFVLAVHLAPETLRRHCSRANTPPGHQHQSFSSPCRVATP